MVRLPRSLGSSHLIAVVVSVWAVAGCGGHGGGNKDSGPDATSDAAPDVADAHDAGQDMVVTETGGDATDAGRGDVTPPAALTATVLNRRDSSFQLDWTSPVLEAGPTARAPGGRP